MATCSSVQEYYHSVKVHNYDDQRKSFDGSTVLVEKIEVKPFLELTVRSEGFEVKARNETLPIHFRHVVEQSSSV